MKIQASVKGKAPRGNESPHLRVRLTPELRRRLDAAAGGRRKVSEYVRRVLCLALGVPGKTATLPYGPRGRETETESRGAAT